MTPERWKRIEELYHAARGCVPGERSAFLAEACPDDEALRREVEALLNEPGSDDGFLETPVLVVPAELVTPMVGRSLGGYQLQTLLGIGGMGEVYRAHDTKLDRDVAIKVLPAAFTSDPDRLARFAREAQMLAALNHQNICGIYGLEEAEGIQFLILELVEGQTLAQMLANRLESSASGAGLPVQAALNIARQIADALEVAHDKGIVHRDLKPANITITPDRVVKVLDFGLAKAVLEDGSSPDLTELPNGGTADGHRGAVIGTAAYMSPEQARGRPVDKRTDIWAFGCVLYEMLTGRVAFPGDTVSDSIAKILEREPDWSLLPASTPPSIRRLLLRCLTKDPKRRLRDIGDVRLDLDASHEGAAGISERTVQPAAAALFWKWLPWVAAAALAAVLVTRNAPPDEIERGWRFQEIEWEGSSEWDAAITSDAKTVAFLSDAAGEIDIFERPMDSDEAPRNRTADRPSLQVPGILPPLGYYYDDEKLWFSAIFEDPKHLLTKDGKDQPFLKKLQQAPTWGNDRRLAFFTQRRSGDSLHCSDPGDPRPDSEKTVRLTKPGEPDETGLHRHNPVFSIDGKWLYYVRGYVRVWSQNDEMDIFRVSCSDGVEQRLTELNSAITQVAVVDDRTLLFVGRDPDRSGPFLWILDVPTKSVRRVAEAQFFTSVAVSRNRERAVVTKTEPTSQLWRVPIFDGPRQAVEDDASRYDVGTSRALAPRYASEDGLVYFLSGLGPRNGLWSARGGERREIVSGEDRSLFEPPAPSRDGRVAMVYKNPQGKHRLFIQWITGGSESLSEELDVFGTADWSPDRKSIAVGGRLDADSRRGLFVIDVEGPDRGVPRRLKECDCSNPVWSPRGDFIVYSEGFSGQAKLGAIRADRSPYPLPDVLTEDGTKEPLEVSPGGYRFLDETHLVYLPRPESTDFWEFDLLTGMTRQLTRLGIKGTLQGFDVAPDGSHILFDRTQRNSNLVVIYLNPARKTTDK